MSLEMNTYQTLHLEKRAHEIDIRIIFFYNDRCVSLCSGLLQRFNESEAIWQVPCVEVLAHRDAEQAAAPHLRGAVSAVFYEKIKLLALVRPFGCGSRIVFFLPFAAQSGRNHEQSEIR